MCTSSDTCTAEVKWVRSTLIKPPLHVTVLGATVTFSRQVCVIACTHACKSNALRAFYVTMHTCTAAHAADHASHSTRQHHKGQPGAPQPGADGEPGSTNSQATLTGLINSLDRVVPVVCCTSLAQNRSGTGTSRSLRMGMAQYQRRPRQSLPMRRRCPLLQASRAWQPHYPPPTWASQPMPRRRKCWRTG